MKNKINFGSVLCALVLFFLPWIDFQCSGKSMMTQSGVQAVYGGASLSSEMESLGGKGGEDGVSGKEKDSIGAAPLIAVSLLATVLAVAVGIMVCRNPEKFPSYSVAGLAGVALLFILIQMAIGFPMKHKMEESLGGGSKKESSQMPFENAAGMMAAMQINIRYTHLFYVQLVALALPVGILGMGMLDKKEGE